MIPPGMTSRIASNLNFKAHFHTLGASTAGVLFPGGSGRSSKGGTADKRHAIPELFTVSGA